jgi:hypothetical protein
VAVTTRKAPGAVKYPVAEAGTLTAKALGSDPATLVIGMQMPITNSVVLACLPHLGPATAAELVWVRA